MDDSEDFDLEESACEEKTSKLKDEEYTRLRRAALNLLARRDHSVQELFQKLISKTEEESVLSKVLKELENEKLLNDERFAQSYVRYRQSKGYGPSRILSELYDKGVSRNIIDKVMKENNDIWQEVLITLWKSRFKEIMPKNYEEKAKQMRFLYYRGFSSEQIKCLYQQYSKNAD